MAEVNKYFGACKFCGQYFDGSIEGATSQEEADYFATKECNCSDSVVFRKKEKQKSKAKKILSEFISENQQEQPETEIKSCLNSVVDLLSDSKINSAVFLLPAIGSVKILARENKIIVEKKKTASKKSTIELE